MDNTINKPSQRYLKSRSNCCHSLIVILSNEAFNKRTKGKYICPCGRIHKEKDMKTT